MRKLQSIFAKEVRNIWGVRTKVTPVEVVVIAIIIIIITIIIIIIIIIIIR